MSAPVTNDDLRRALAGVLECTRAIEVLIEQGNWLGAAELDAERLRRLRECCARLEPGTAAPGLIAAIGEIVKLNDRLIGAVEHRQRALARDAGMVSTGRKAVAAYGAAR